MTTNTLVDDLISRRLRAVDYRQWRAQVDIIENWAAIIGLLSNSLQPALTWFRKS